MYRSTAKKKNRYMKFFFFSPCRPALELHVSCTPLNVMPNAAVCRNSTIHVIMDEDLNIYSSVWHSVYQHWLTQ